MEETDDAERRRRLREQPVIAVEPHAGGTVVRLGGELDLYNAPVLREALLAVTEELPERLILDLSEVNFIDSTTLGALIEARGKLPAQHAMLLAAPARETRRALQVSGLKPHLNVHETVNAALAAPI